MHALKYLIFALILSIGLGSSGYFIGHGLSNFKQNTNSIRVKGIGEKNIEADYAIWTIPFFVNRDEFQEAKDQYEKDLQVVLDFLKENKFSSQDIQVMTPNVNQKVDRDSEMMGKNIKESYEVMGTVVVKTSHVRKVEDASQKTFELLRKGIWLKGDQYATNPRYIIADFDRFRPEIFAQAIDSAHRMAQTLAEKSGVKIGSVISVDQGQFSVNSRIGNENEEAYIDKKAKVISYLTFEVNP